MNRIYVWIKRPGESPRHVLLCNKLEALQKTVGGFIETVTIAENMVIICNEEGRFLGLQKNCSIAGYDFVGTIILAGIKEDEFADAPIDDETVLKLMYPQLFEE